MRRLFQTLAVLLAFACAAVVIMVILGSGLPREHVATATAVLSAPQGQVWSMLEDVEAQPHWRTGLRAVEPLPNDADGHRCWTEVQRHMRMPLCEEIVDAPVTRVVAIVDPTLAFGGTWTYNLTALTPGTTELAITERGTVESPLWRFAGHYLSHEDASVRAYEADLQRAIHR